jgi:hypothetical protein
VSETMAAAEHVLKHWLLLLNGWLKHWLLLNW